MTRLLHAFRRLPGLSLADCQAYWRETHGPLVQRRLAALRASAYVQLHTIEHPLTEAMRASRAEIEPYDGLGEIWFDAPANLFFALDTDEGREALKTLAEDQRHFVDSARSAVWLAVERNQLQGGSVQGETVGGSVKVLYAFRGRRDLSREECQRYWGEQHAALVRRHAPAIPFRRYVQLHAIGDRSGLALGNFLGTEDAYDGLCQLEGSLEELVAGATTPEGLQAAEQCLEDEGHFIDPSRSTLWLAAEQLVSFHEAAIHRGPRSS